MKKLIIVVVMVSLVGCANSRYPNWESVNIVSSVENKPCIGNGITEKCDDGSKDDCDIWFKKRATLVHSNTAVINPDPVNDEPTGRYFQCQTGNPLYKSLVFNKSEYGTGINSVTGQAFLTQQGGGVVTCAGNSVEMYPDTAYFSEVFDDIGNGFAPSRAFSSEDQKFLKTSQCDAQGNFEFNKIPAGKWIIGVKVTWNVNSVGYNGFYYYTKSNPQGGALKKSVNVQNNEINKFIISR